MKASMGVKSANKRNKKFALEYRKEISYLKNDLKMRKKESLLETFNPKLKYTLNQIPSELDIQK